MKKIEKSNDLFSSKIILPKEVCLIKKNITVKDKGKEEKMERVEKRLKKGYHLRKKGGDNPCLKKTSLRYLI